MSVDLRTEFTRWYWNEFAGASARDPKSNMLFEIMAECKEGSPWHREESVAIHTNMVVSEYLARADNDWGINQTLGGFAAAFHDVGKPGSRQRKWKKERGDYNSFNGHESKSARLWEDWACSNWKMLQDRFCMTLGDIFRVGFMIEYHKPWDIRKPEKRHQMAMTLMMHGILPTFIDLVKADTWGRISDDMDEKKRKVTHWCNTFQDMARTLDHRLGSFQNNDGQPILYVPIAASGSGKSTLAANSCFTRFSLDDLRVEFYGEPYEEAFAASIKDKTFKAQANARFIEMVQQQEDIYVDATNTSKKTRRWFVTEARRHGYFLQAILLPVSYDTIRDRQFSRTDKTVPEEAVNRQYFGIQLPQYGEFDDIVFDGSNLL